MDDNKKMSDMDAENNMVFANDVPVAQRGRYMAQEIWAFDDTGYNLTVEEQLFVRSYIIDRNEIAALKRLGYDDSTLDSLRRMAKRHLRSAEVQGAIEVMAKNMMSKLEITAENVNRSMASIAFTDITEIMQFDGVSSTLLPSHLWPKHAQISVKSVKAGQFGLNIEFHDKQKALDFLAKQTGLVDSEVDSSRAAAEAAASSAVNKIMEVVARSQQLKLEAKEQVIDQ
jgi:phage terminase small subunit